MLTKHFYHRRGKPFTNAPLNIIFINPTNIRAIKPKSKRLPEHKKATNNIRPRVFRGLSPQLILINVKDTCKTLIEIFIQWHIVHW
ncbi:hypothetical protein APQ14_03900 [Vibrio toranzoniae]|uniref:Uncharacterized protein n=1 Tax=Vibrio toranzoniae TaxID=1194427 RepID=A0A120DH63_9VIBR|nr:hypothetical protein APQ14_03900 [Vibrio toranzoniae]